MCEDIKYPEEAKQDEFDRLLKQMVKDRKMAADLLFKEARLMGENRCLRDRLSVLKGFVEEVGKMAKALK